MSDELGTMVYVGQDQDSFFGSMSSKTISEATQQKVDAEIRRILDEQYSVARKLIEKNRRKVEAMAKALLEYETIDADQINDIMAGKKARPPKPKQTPNPPKIDKGSSGTKVVVAPQPSAKG